MTSQTKTPHRLASLPQKQSLVDEFAGQPLHALRTPVMVIDRAMFAKNCALMHEKAKAWGAGFRAHVKSHKTAEGTRLQLVSTADKTSAIVVSTMMEAWEVVEAGLVADGTVRDILYGLPVGVNKIEDLSSLWEELARHEGTVRILVDHPDQVQALEEFELKKAQPRIWSVFVKVDGGQKRAGVPPSSPLFEALLTKLFTSPVINVHGFYCHAGNAYASTSLPEASSFLSAEVEVVNNAAALALEMISRPGSGFPRRQRPFVLSVGSTPTAHAASAEDRSRLASLLNGDMELHAGNYPLLDLQQVHTSLVGKERVAQRVLATVISYYPRRGEGDTDEALCDAGAIAMSKDTGPSGGFGDVIGQPWRLGRVSQEHGILVQTSTDTSKLKLGEVVQIVGQHACLITAAYPWYYVVDSDQGGEEKVVDVWVPWKGW